jgi:hypothetical protein
MGIRSVSLGIFFLPVLCFSADLSRLSWGMRNTGESQQFLIDHYTSGVIEGVVGEDIHPIRDMSTARKPVVVAVLDTGVDESHPSLADALAKPGFNAIDGSTNVKDSHGHGTHVSGIIAGRLGHEGFVGVSQSALILPIRVIQNGPNAPIRPQDMSATSGTALTENVARGIVHAIERGAKIIHLSLAWPATIRSKSVDDAVEMAKDRNVLIVASAGNDSTDALVQPCLYANVVCVGAHGPDGAFTHFSNHGSMVDLLAPGISILSSWPTSKAPVTFAGQTGYEFRNGTSMAAPFVTGALAELLSLGFEPREAVARILLSTRRTKTESRYRSEVGGITGRSVPSVVKKARFGNLDLSAALHLKPAPLLVPEIKEPVMIEWNGKSRSEKVTIAFINRWSAARKVSIRIQNQVFREDLIPENGRFVVSFDYPLSFDSETTPQIPAEVSIEGQDPRTFLIPLSLVRVLREDSIPAQATIHSALDFHPDDSMSIRSVVPVPPLTTQSHLFLKDESAGVSATLAEENRSLHSTLIKGVSSDQLLNWYQIPDGGYRAIFSVKNPGEARPSFLMLGFDRNLNLLSQFRLGTEVTVLPENFRFISANGEFSPHFISHGFTPKADLPPYDPWNPEYRDEKRLRAYYMKGSELRLIPLGEKLTPLFLLPGDLILATEGSGYLQSYSLHLLKDGKIIQSTPLELPAFRMLAGFIEARIPIQLDSEGSSGAFFSGKSSPGSLRVSSLDQGNGTTDEILYRPAPLDSLMSLIGVFTGKGSSSFFAESHYDLVFYPGKNERPFSTSLHRYSYIPSMIFSKNLFPVSVFSQKGNSLPGIYLPAALTNDFISEVWIANPEQREIRHPLGLRLKTSGNCRAVGNLISGAPESPSKMVFWCGNRRIDYPITIRE